MTGLTTADQLRWLADVIDAVGEQAIDVHDAESLGVDGDRLTAELIVSAPRPDGLESIGPDAIADEPTNGITEADLESIAFVDEDEAWETADDLEDDQEDEDEPRIFDAQTPAEEEFRERMDQEFGYADEELASPELADEPIGPEPATDDDREESLDEDENVQEDDDPLSPGERAIVDALEDAGEELTSTEVVDRVVSYADGTVYGYLSTLKDTSHVEARTDPDQHQRMLYRVPGVDVDEDVSDAESDESDDEDAPGLAHDHDPREEIVEAVGEQGELNAGEISMVSGISTADEHLSDLVDEGILAVREDPDDGRRSLYGLPDDESDTTTESASEADDPTTALAEDGDDAKQSDQEAIDEVLEESDRPDWLSRDADEIVEAESNLRRSLEEVLDIAANADTVIDFKTRAAFPLGRTKDLLWELGLRKQSPDTMLIEEPERSDRIETLREVYVDREVTA